MEDSSWDPAAGFHVPLSDFIRTAIYETSSTTSCEVGLRQNLGFRTTSSATEAWHVRFQAPNGWIPSSVGNWLVNQEPAMILVGSPTFQDLFPNLCSLEAPVVLRLDDQPATSR